MRYSSRGSLLYNTRSRQHLRSNNNYNKQSRLIMKPIGELTQQNISDRLECLEWYLKYYKKQNTELVHAYEESQVKMVKVLESIEMYESMQEQT